MRNNLPGRAIQRRNRETSFAQDAADAAWHANRQGGHYGHYAPYGGSDDQWAGNTGEVWVDSHTARYGALPTPGQPVQPGEYRATFDSEPYRAARVQTADPPRAAPASEDARPRPGKSDQREQSPGLARAEDDDTLLNGRQT